MSDLYAISRCIDADRMEVESLRSVIDRGVRQQLVEQAQPGAIRTTMLSCVNGRWDDLIRDVQRCRITPGDAFDIVAQIRDARLIGVSFADTMRERITEQVP